MLFVSLHQWPFYPGTGGPDDQRETTLNIPLPAGSGDAEYLRAFDRACRARGRAVRAGARPRLGGVRRPRWRPARRDARQRERLPRALTAVRRNGATRRGGARGRLRGRDAAGPRRRPRSTASSRRAGKPTAPFRGPSAAAQCSPSAVLPKQFRCLVPIIGRWPPHWCPCLGERHPPPWGIRGRSPTPRGRGRGCSSASRRDETFSFRSRLFTCERTVCSEM